MWRLDATDRTPEDLDAQIQEILSKLTSDMGAWMLLHEKFKLDLFCGIFLEGDNEGLAVSAENACALGSRGIELAFDIYGRTREEQGREQSGR